MFSKNRYMVIIKKIHMKGSYTIISLYNAMTASMTVCVMKRVSLGGSGWTYDPLAPTSLNAGITGMCHHSWPEFLNYYHKASLYSKD